MGNHIKEGIPWATASALAAVDFAVAGFTGPTDLLDNDAIFDRKTLLEGLGDGWAIRGIYFKPYGCCRWAHAAIDAILALQTEFRFAVADIQSIEIDAFSWALRLNNETAPKTEEAAQYSVPFCTALSLTRGADALLEIGSGALADPATIALAGKVKLAVDPVYDAMFPRQIPSRVRIRTDNAVLTKEVVAPLGEPNNPMDWARLLQKFARVAEGKLAKPVLEDFFAAFDALGDGRPAPLIEALGRPVLAA